jgi:4-amino-4-deoxy-L-arabinose transferase-like glycosyltransferase
VSRGSRRKGIPRDPSSATDGGPDRRCPGSAGVWSSTAGASTRAWPSARGLLVAIVLAAGFLLRLWTAHAYWSWFDREFPGAWERSRVVVSQDGTQYVQQADPDSWQRPLRGHWQERPYYRPPLASYYFVFLSRATGFDRLAISACQALLALLACLAIYRLVERTCGFRTALASLLWSCLHPVLVYFDVSFEDGALALVLLALALATFVRHGERSLRGLAAAGTFMGLAILARPNTALVSVCLLIALGRTGGKRRRIAAFAFAVPVVILAGLPTLHNYRASGRFAFVVDTNGENLYWGNGARPEDRILLQGFWDIPQVDVGSPGWLLIRDLTARHAERSIDRAFRAEVLAHARAQPLDVAWGLVSKAARHFASDEIPRNENFETLRQAAPVFRWPYPPYPVTACLALIGFVSLPAAQRRWRWILLSPWISAFATEVVYFNASRYRSACLPFLLPLAVLGVRRCYEEIRARRPLPIGAIAVALATAYFVGDSIVSPLERRQHLSASAFKSAMLEAYADDTGQLRVPDEGRFLRRLKTALELEPRNLAALAVQATYLTATGRREEALAARDSCCPRCDASDRLCASTCERLAATTPR